MEMVLLFVAALVSPRRDLRGLAPAKELRFVWGEHPPERQALSNYCELRNDDLGTFVGPVFEEFVVRPLGRNEEGNALKGALHTREEHSRGRLCYKTWALANGVLPSRRGGRRPIQPARCQRYNRRDASATTGGMPTLPGVISRSRTIPPAELGDLTFRRERLMARVRGRGARPGAARSVRPAAGTRRRACPRPCIVGRVRQEPPPRVSPGRGVCPGAGR